MSNEEIVQQLKKKLETECQKFEYDFSNDKDIIQLRDNPRSSVLGEFSWAEAEEIFRSLGDGQLLNLKEMCKREGISSCDRVKISAVFSYDPEEDNRTVHAVIIPEPVMSTKFRVKISPDLDEEEDKE